MNGGARTHEVRWQIGYSDSEDEQTAGDAALPKVSEVEAGSTSTSLGPTPPSVRKLESDQRKAYFQERYAAKQDVKVQKAWMSELDWLAYDPSAGFHCKV